jgi:hypothetical protein
MADYEVAGENSDASRECTFFGGEKKIYVGIWSRKMMFIPCINIVYR